MACGERNRGLIMRDMTDTGLVWLMNEEIKVWFEYR